VTAVLDVDVLLEADGVLAVDKPAGLATTGEKDDLRQAIADHFDIEPGFDGPSFLGRLDRPTSGIVIACLTRQALRTLEPPWRDGRLHKDYLVVVHGRTKPKGTIDVALVDRRHRTDAREEARTEYRTLAQTREFSLVQARLLTGRTHQIRRHMKAIGHPVVFDPRYGDARREEDLQSIVSAGLMLHAVSISHEGDAPLLPRVLEAPVPERFTRVLAHVGMQSAARR
jgi:23S rRNA-/tRNA-specific pseudouridylate synthase